MMFSLSFGAPVRNLLEAPDAPDRDESNEMLILSNTEKTYGAAMLAQDGGLQKVADYLGDNFHVLPSSTHEVIILAESTLPESPTQNLTLMVQADKHTKAQEKKRPSILKKLRDKQSKVNIKTKAPIQETGKTHNKHKQTSLG